jgi:hypothetical protein
MRGSKRQKQRSNNFACVAKGNIDGMINFYSKQKWPVTCQLFSTTATAHTSPCKNMTRHQRGMQSPTCLRAACSARAVPASPLRSIPDARGRLATVL